MSNPSVIDLSRLRLHVEPPRAVTGTDQGHCWFPDLLRFSTGELMLNHSLNVDSNSNTFNAQAVLLSGDGGRS